MRPFPGSFVVVLGIALSGCASALGTSDSVNISSEPAGASCRVERMAETLVVIPETPATVTLSRSRFPIDVFCTKEGVAGAQTVWPGVNPLVYGDLLLGGVPYLADSAFDADRTLPEAVVVRFPLTAQ